LERKENKRKEKKGKDKRMGVRVQGAFPKLGTKWCWVIL
jgi:hypothetical protein